MTVAYNLTVARHKFVSGKADKILPYNNVPLSCIHNGDQKPMSVRLPKGTCYVKDGEQKPVEEDIERTNNFTLYTNVQMSGECRGMVLVGFGGTTVPAELADEHTPGL
jgi:hypothetical protein